MLVCYLVDLKLSACMNSVALDRVKDKVSRLTYTRVRSLTIALTFPHPNASILMKILWLLFCQNAQCTRRSGCSFFSQCFVII